ncbi:hypothetical protein DSM3645_15290 [Blastopirellula marina DSM 3645]|uniref:Uncharacterized protein n=1 Tax=Blastopirellula marina DSM 3645 TaxID=314230 RepID=A3ZZ15_9BACT|nr:hypothetical protein DSM3645_15290 [Blastopirellula marina DSM 3645]
MKIIGAEFALGASLAGSHFWGTDIDE